jgi:hypothetical protein
MEHTVLSAKKAAAAPILELQRQCCRLGGKKQQTVELSQNFDPNRLNDALKSTCTAELGTVCQVPSRHRVQLSLNRTFDWRNYSWARGAVGGGERITVSVFTP